MGAFLAKHVSPKHKDDLVILSMPTISENTTPTKVMDPRSPNPFRTPMGDLPFRDIKPLTKAQNLTNKDNISTSTTTTPTKLKTKLLRDLGYSFDPRSPAVNFDRTPLNLNDSNMTDDFSLTGLSLNESDIQNSGGNFDRTPLKLNDSSMTDNFSLAGISLNDTDDDQTRTKENHIETFYTPQVTAVKLSEVEMDPRSPSIDIERTPLNLRIVADEIQEDMNMQSVVEEDAEKPSTLESVVMIENVKNMIYTDDHEDHEASTPNTKSDKIESDVRQRTPLSCLINTQGSHNRIERRVKPQNKINLARSIFKDSMLPANHNANKLNNSSSKIPVFRRSCSMEKN